MDKIKAQKAIADANSQKAFGPRLPFFKIKASRVTIRVLPHWTTEGVFANQFWKEAGQHWNVKEDQTGPVLCPKSTEGFPSGESCPICDFANKLKADRNSISAQALYKEIRAKKTYFLAVIDLNDPVYTAKDKMNEETKAGDPKVQIYSCPQGVFNDMISDMTENDIDITSLAEGYDVTIEKKERGGKADYTEYKVIVKKKSTKAPVPESFVTPSLENIGWKMSTKELMALLAEGKGGKAAAQLQASTEKEEETSYLSSDEPEGDLESLMRAQAEG
jgi:hypothetical protein